MSFVTHAGPAVTVVAILTEAAEVALLLSIGPYQSHNMTG